MIVTVTCNPAIDKSVCENETIYDIGGKGINVSKVLHKFNQPSLATGLIGDENKMIIIDGLDELKIPHHFVTVEGKVRTNTKMIIDNKLYEDNEKGPEVAEERFEKLLKHLSTYVNTTVVVSGSAPKNLHSDIYYRMVKLLKDNHNYVILDCSGDLFKEAIKAKPDVIKPNKDEICDFFGIEYDLKEIVIRCRKLLEDGLKQIVVSLGEDGALFMDEYGTYRCKALEVDYANAVGAGDAMVAVLAYGKENHFDERSIIRLAMAAAAASVEMEGSKAPELSGVLRHIGEVEIEEME